MEDATQRPDVAAALEVLRSLGVSRLTFRAVRHSDDNSIEYEDVQGSGPKDMGWSEFDAAASAVLLPSLEGGEPKTLRNFLLDLAHELAEGEMDREAGDEAHVEMDVRSGSISVEAYEYGYDEEEEEEEEEDEPEDGLEDGLPTP